jgi:spermidine/putrescine-binding protein
MTLALAAGPASSTEAITFVSFGGAYTESQNKAYIEPFQQESGVRAAVRKSATEVA